MLILLFCFYGLYKQPACALLWQLAAIRKVNINIAVGWPSGTSVCWFMLLRTKEFARRIARPESACMWSRRTFWVNLTSVHEFQVKISQNVTRIKMSGNIIGLRPIFLDLDFLLKRPSHKNGITSQAIKWEGLIFMKNVSDKMFLVCCKNENEWQHHRATNNISRPWFLAEEVKSQKRNNVSGHKIRTTHFHKKCFG